MKIPSLSIKYFRAERTFQPAEVAVVAVLMFLMGFVAGALR